MCIELAWQMTFCVKAADSFADASLQFNMPHYQRLPCPRLSGGLLEPLFFFLSVFMVKRGYLNAT